MDYDECKRTAVQLGSEAGQAAASWVFDGNTDDARYAAVLQAIKDCDGAVLDEIRTPNLSGEWADEMDAFRLGEMCRLTDAVPADSDGYSEALQELCDMWENAAAFAMQAELERQCLAHLGCQACGEER